MAANSFNFSSPGVFLNEIDQSQVQQQPQPIGPIIIGRSVRGPSMVPTKVKSYEDFVKTFGEPHPGGDTSGDTWRSGVPSGPTYAPYAAQAWLANSPSITFVRLAGVNSSTAATAGKAGWTIGDADAANKIGAYGLFVAASASSGPITGTLAAVWYCKGTVPVLSGTLLGGTAAVQKNGAFILAASGKFKILLSGSSGGIDDETYKSIDFTPSNGTFIRKSFNTSPENVSLGTTGPASGNRYGYWLGESFENDVTILGGSETVGIILPLSNYNTQRAEQPSVNSNAARTGWFVSQAGAGDIANFTPSDNATKLFRFIALDTGDWIRNNLKVTISNINPPQNDAQKWATFDVELRRSYDTDSNKKTVENYSGCTLDPASPNYVARKIGDVYHDWDDTERALQRNGVYPNNSNFIRVEMYAEELDSSLVPFGVLGPLKPDNAGFDNGAALYANTTGFIGNLTELVSSAS